MPKESAMQGFQTDPLPGAAALSGSGSLVSNAVLSVFGSANLSGLGSLAVTPIFVQLTTGGGMWRPLYLPKPRIVDGAAHLSGHGWLSASGERERVADDSTFEDLLALELV
jgi:hypothetical protein